VERLIGSTRREYLDAKLCRYKRYFNEARVHSSLNGNTPAAEPGSAGLGKIDLGDYHWQSFCDGLFQIPVPA
jgi:hypothetical protein